MSRDLPSPVLQWRVDRSYNASDHNNILFQYETNTTSTKQKIRPWSRADWPLFTNTLSNTDFKLPEVMSMKKLDKLVQQTYDHIKNCLLYTS